MTYHLVGLKFGQLTVLSKLDARNEKGKTQWMCQCLCGDKKVAYTYQLTKNFTGLRSCGKCEWHIKHKEAYTSWMSMKQRCDDSNRKDYKYYGGRGITYEPRWKEFVQFYIDMGDPPNDTVTGERLSLDRKDVHGMYSKENCKWSTRSEQQLNKTNSPINAGFDLEGK
jgi:hypothetical protein